MAALEIKTAGGLLESEIENRDREVAEEAARGRRKIVGMVRKGQLANERRMDGIERSVDRNHEEVLQVKCDVAAVKQDVAAVKSDIGEVKADVKKILEQFATLKGEVEEVKEETAEGVKITKKVTLIGEAGKELRLDKVWNRVWPWLSTAGALYATSRVLGWLFGPEIRDAILRKLTGH